MHLRDNVGRSGRGTFTGAVAVPSSSTRVGKGGGTAPSTTATRTMSLQQKVDMLRNELSIKKGDTLAQTIDTAVQELGLKDVGGARSLMQKVDACLETLGTPTAGASAAQVPGFDAYYSPPRGGTSPPVGYGGSLEGSRDGSGFGGSGFGGYYGGGFGAYGGYDGGYGGYDDYGSGTFGGNFRSQRGSAEERAYARAERKAAGGDVATGSQ